MRYAKQYNNNNTTGRRAFMEIKNMEWALTEKEPWISKQELLDLARRFLDVMKRSGSLSVAENAAKAMDEWASSIDVSPSVDKDGVDVDVEKVLECVRKEYKLCGDETVIAKVIIEEKGMTEFLLEAAQEIRKRFGSDTEISLAYESEDSSRESLLFARVHTELTVADALDKVAQIDQEWLIDNVDRVQGRFNFDVEWK